MFHIDIPSFIAGIIACFLMTLIMGIIDIIKNPED